MKAASPRQWQRRYVVLLVSACALAVMLLVDLKNRPSGPIERLLVRVPGPGFFYVDQKNANSDAWCLASKISRYSNSDIVAGYDALLEHQTSLGFFDLNKRLCVLNRLLYTVPADELYPLQEVRPGVYNIEHHDERTITFTKNALVEYREFEVRYPRRKLSVEENCE